LAIQPSLAEHRTGAAAIFNRTEIMCPRLKAWPIVGKTVDGTVF
jgi:hypothetical protein